ncbi:MAG TPA: MmcQ/YjbR family DNA-binding protein [Xanthomonadales bacterium]|nr:MmcQ/YjbR family DNA-binding protein [Xanthomonadales bacterium]
MKLENLVEYCRSLPYIVEDIKWGNDLVFSIKGGKMFCVFGFESDVYTGMSFKVDDHRFLEMTDRPQFTPAPYMARARWVYLAETSGISEKELQELISRSHQLYFEKLSKKAQRALQEF